MKWGVPGTLSPSHLSPVGTPCLGLLSSGNRASFLGSFAILSRTLGLLTFVICTSLSPQLGHQRPSLPMRKARPGV